MSPTPPNSSAKETRESSLPAPGRKPSLATKVWAALYARREGFDLGKRKGASLLSTIHRLMGTTTGIDNGAIRSTSLRARKPYPRSWVNFQNLTFLNSLNCLRNNTYFYELRHSISTCHYHARKSILSAIFIFEDSKNRRTTKPIQIMFPCNFNELKSIRIHALCKIPIKASCLNFDIQHFIHFFRVRNFAVRTLFRISNYKKFWSLTVRHYFLN